MDFGDRLKLCREKKGFTQKFIAEKVGIKNNTLSSYESNKRQPDFDTLKALANLYEVSIDYLLTGDEHRVSSDEMWKELLDPKTELFFKDLKSAPEEKIAELIRFWEFINDRDD
ncbi:helix-turn-helix domain-containing protein [Priestia megaterium]|uniref:helix-turn-helix domain-containing protein n=1 Tax=Priestia megaterium TaxID=1404 RepID=UPI001A952E22|nr:helix-turn-helix transcriptional regulator [Priestia megaterium]QSX20035.1 helix-turn-helix domain-containing protein [Priestia megaterium]